MAKYAAMGKVELRAACKEVGIKYGKLDNEGMRAALRAKEEENSAPVKSLFGPEVEQANAAKVVPASVQKPVHETIRENIKAKEVKVDKKPVDLNDGCPLCKGDPSSQTWAVEGESCFCHECGKTYSMRTGKEIGLKAGTKIEKDRPEQNGVKRPSAGGMCRAVWDFLDAKVAEGAAVTAKDVKAWAPAQGWNPNNASIEFYQWRKFHGIRGRQA
jgi:hypothetical protein